MPPAPMVATLLAYHDTAGGGSGDLAVLFVVLGVLATAAWLIFSELRFAHTVMTAVGGWIAGLTLFFLF